MITDRNDLDDQPFETFAVGRALPRQAPVQAESREQLKSLLDRAAGASCSRRFRSSPRRTA
jgi:type I restriction enzyme R subunit